MPLTPDQNDAVIAREKTICVDAGAGSGKTRVLVQRILDLIERDKVKLSQIVAITFTDKAAAEMKSRLRRACREKAPQDDPTRLSFWRSVERQVDTARITTIHSFCGGILRENALALGIDPDFGIMTETESEFLRLEVIASSLHAMLESEDATAQRAAVEYGMSGLKGMLDDLLKRRGLVDRVLRSGNYETAKSVRTRWSELLPRIQRELLRALCRSRQWQARIRELEQYAGICSSPDDKREQLRVELIQRLCELADGGEPKRINATIDAILEMNAKGGCPKQWSSRDAYDRVKDILAKVRKRLGDIRNKTADPEIDARAAELTASLLYIYKQTAQELRNAKLARNAMDFDDLIVETARVLADATRGDDSVRARTARSIRHLLIDEFQDTDGVQLEIASRLSTWPDGPSLFIVGDAKQSIYYFRGAEVDVFRDARNAAERRLPMRGNFRTVPPLITFLNDFFEQSGLLAAVEQPYSALEPQREPLECSSIEFLVPFETETARIEDYRIDEATMIAARLRSACEGAEQLSVCDPHTHEIRPARYGDAAILLRSLSNVHIYERALREAGIPYTLIAGKGFYERQEVVDLRNALSVIANPWDELALVAFLRSPMVGVTDDSLVALAGGIGAPVGVARAFYSDARIEPAQENARLERARSLVHELRAKQYIPLPELLRQVLNVTAYEAIVLRQFMGIQRAGNLRKVCALAEGFSRNGPAHLRAFVRYLAEMAAKEIREGEAAAHSDNTNAVTLMTVHKAKGLEFPLVFVADMGRSSQSRSTDAVIVHKDFGIAAKVVGPDGAPARSSIHSAICAVQADEESAEQARVLYVAITRAKDHLFLCGAPSKKDSTSWIASFDELYDVCGRADGETIFGKNWRAVARRTIVPVSRAESATAIDVDVDIDQLRLRIGPVTNLPTIPRTIPVTALVRKMLGEHRDAGYPAALRRPGISPALRGEIVHAFFQRWNFKAAPESVIADVLRAVPLASSDAQQLAEDLKRIAARIASHSIGTLLASNETLRREVPFVLQLAGVIVRGTVDALLNGDTVIDYKTGKYSPESHAAYMLQLQIYAAACRRLAGADVKRALLVYVDADDVVREVDVSPVAVDTMIHNAEAAIGAMTVSPISVDPLGRSECV